jgi:hypothetical protein
MKLIRSLVFPWFAFFLLTVAAIVVLGLKFPELYIKILQTTSLDSLRTLDQQTAKTFPPDLAILALGMVLCLMANLSSLGGVGIWMAESLPDSLRYGSGGWISRAVKATLVAAAFWFVGQLSFIPLIWQGIVIPVVFTTCLFVAVFNLMGPILKWSSNLSARRFFTTVLSLPVLVAVPGTALYLGQMIVFSYKASQADLTIAQTEVAIEVIDPELKPIQIKGKVLSIAPNQLRFQSEWPQGSAKIKTLEVDLQTLSPKLAGALPKKPSEKEITLTLELRAIREAALQAKATPDPKDIRGRLASSKAETRASALRDLYESPGICDEFSKEVLAALIPTGHSDVVFWGIKAVECANVRTVLGLPRMAQIMLEHKDPKIRAAAIRGLRSFGDDNVRGIAYMLVKRLSEKEPPEVIEATAAVMAALGGEQQRWSGNRLKSLLDDQEASLVAARTLIQDYGQADMVAEYVAQNLGTSGSSRTRAVDMICLLPPAKRSVAEKHVANVIASIQNPEPTDPGIRALNCLGRTGFQAIRDEVTNPQQLEKSVAARALAEADVKQFPEAIEVADSCSRDTNPTVRKWCSQSLGRIGAPALPKILDLLESGNKSLKDAGQNALAHFDDPTAKDELQQVMLNNTGWMANNKKLQIARAVGIALLKIDNEQKMASAESTSTDKQ